ncbi:MAG TPA: ATP12 family protein [Sphingopyxis sp.]|nr:ATP12 family protein [Sphingopyxis sp.]
MKKFWKTAAITALEDGYSITLDNRPLRTPARALLSIPNLSLAEAIVAEWDAQGEDIDPASMPMTGLANATIDLAAANPVEFAAPLAEYAASDLLCYRDARDSALQKEQAAAWNPILHWAEQHFGVEFILTQGVLPVDQPEETIAALRAATFALAPHQLAALAPLVTISGSLVSGLAAMERAFDAEILWQAVALDDLYQERRWGEDAEAVKMREHRRTDWHNAIRYLSLATSS